MNENNQSSVNWKVSFFTIWVGQALSLLGSSLVQFALIWYLTTETGSATVLTRASRVAFLPQVLLGPIAGTVVGRGCGSRVKGRDRRGRRISDGVRRGVGALGWVQI